MIELTHDEFLQRVIALRNGALFSLERAVGHFLEGLSGHSVRGRSVLMDFLRLQHFAPHEFVGAQHCEVCGVPAVAEIRADAALESAYAGHSSNEVVENLLPRWEDVLTCLSLAQHMRGATSCRRF